MEGKWDGEKWQQEEGRVWGRVIGGRWRKEWVGNVGLSGLESISSE